MFLISLSTCPSWLKYIGWGGVVGWGGGSCDYGVTPVPIRLGFGTALVLGLRGPDLGLGLDNKI